MMASARRGRSGLLLALAGLVLATSGLPALAEAERCCEEMAAHAGAHCEGLSAASCCDCPHPVYTAPNAPVPQGSAASAVALAPPVRVSGAGAGTPATLPDHCVRPIRSPVLRL